jgi:hypothetical protein
MIVIRQEGRERYCEAKLDALDEVTDWVNQYRQFWQKRFNSLDTTLKK